MARESKAWQLPELSDTSPAGIRAWARSLVSSLGRLTGQSAITDNAALDQAVTFRDLISAGLAVEAPKGHGVPVLPPGFSVTSPPPAPTGLAVARLAFNMRLTWDAPSYGYHGKTEVWRADSDSLTLAEKIAEVPDGVVLYEDGFVESPAWYYWIRFVSKADVIGPFNSISGTADNAEPEDVTGFDYVADNDGMALVWNSVSDKDIDYYELRIGASWGAGTLLARVKGTSLPWKAQTGGSYRIWVAARDVTGYYSASPTSQDITVNTSTITSLTAAIVGDTLVLTYTATRGNYAVANYEVRYGATWGAGTLVEQLLGTSAQIKVNWSGLRTFHVAAIDTAGNYSASTSVDVNIVSPGAPTAFRAEVVDNNVLLYWTAPATGSLPVATYEIRRGDTFAGADVIGEKSGLFTSVFEFASGTYNYWVRAKDTAGNYGPEASLSQRVNQPPDFVLFSQGYLDLTASTISNGLQLDDDTVVLPYLDTQTYDQSYTTPTWTNDSDAIGAGYEYYAQKVDTSGYIELIADLTETIPPANARVTATYTEFAGTPGVSYQLAHSTDDITYTDLAPGPDGYIDTDFRYVKITMTVTSTDMEFLLLTKMHLRVTAKQRTWAGAGTCNSGDSGGTRFLLTEDGTEISKTGNNTLGQDTITGLASTTDLAIGMSVEGTGIAAGSTIKSVDSASQITLTKVTTGGSVGGTYLFGQSVFADLLGPPLVQPKGTTAIIPVVDFVDGYAPLSFKVLLFNDSGTRVTADIAWSARGF